MPLALGETEKKSSSPFAAHFCNLVASATLSTLRLLDVYFINFDCLSLAMLFMTLYEISDTTSLHKVKRFTRRKSMEKH